MPSAADHPRSRGVYRSLDRDRSRATGSSPLARGLQYVYHQWYQPRRIIPARAGFTVSIISSPLTGPDHPRSRGVYRRRIFLSSWARGSSPLARGLRSGARCVDGEAGIIPARAGFTRAESLRRARSRDHPRSRGVYIISITMVPESARIIPARAGFTAPEDRRSVPLRDHPRSRGVYPIRDRLDLCHEGSSPLARGLLIINPRLRGQVGIIPARAGFTTLVTHPN